MAGRKRADADGGWKDIIEEYTAEFLDFYFPQVHEAIDFSQPVAFLDLLCTRNISLDN